MTTLLLQSATSGFGPGHYGWVSSHVLAQIVHATPQNGFLGYTLSVAQPNGVTDLVYFDRYPIFFSGAMNLLLSPWQGNFTAQIQVAKTLMNVIFCLLILFCFLTLRRLTNKTFESALATMVAFSSATILFYKDMVHFDQPALLGIFILIYEMVRYSEVERDQPHFAKKALVRLTLVAVFAACLGRGYATFFVLAVWIGYRIWQRRNWLKEKTLIAGLFAVVISGACLAHNILQEARIRNVSPMETSIVKSATARLGVRQLDPEVERKARFSKVLVLQVEGYFMNLVPAAFGNPDTITKGLRRSFKDYWGIVAVPLILFLFLYWIPKKAWQGWKVLQIETPFASQATLQSILVTLLFSGIFWSLAMRKLTAFHQYTSMYLLPMTATIMCFVFVSLKLDTWQNKRKNILAAVVVAIFVSGLFQMKTLHDTNQSDLNVQASDFTAIYKTLGSQMAYVHLPMGHRSLVAGAPYASGYFLPHQFVSDSAFNEDIVKNQKIPVYVISTDENHKRTSLTPENKKYFLSLVK